MDTTVKDSSTTVTQVVNADIANTTIVVNLATWKTKTLLRLAEVLEISQPLQVPQVTDI